MFHQIRSLILLVGTLLIYQSCYCQPETIVLKLREKAVGELHHALRTQNGWAKVHAAEYLLALSYTDDVQSIFANELQQHSSIPQYRIGIWRTLARASLNADSRSIWVNKIWDVFLDDTSPDRLHACETLAKLGENLLSRKPDVARRLVMDDDIRLATFIRWGIAVNSDDEHSVSHLFDALNSEDANIRKLAAFGIRFNIQATPKQWQTLYKAAIDEPDNSAAAVFLLGAAYVRMPDSEESKEITQQLNGRLRKLLFSEMKANRYHACEALAEKGAVSDLPFLSQLLNGKSPILNTNVTPEQLAAQNADVRIAAANAILRILRRTPKSMGFRD